MRRPFNLKAYEELKSILGHHINPYELDAYEDAIMRYPRPMHDKSDWGVVMSDYWAERSVPYKWYEKQKLLVMNYNFLNGVWRMGTAEPLDADNLERAAKLVARMRFPAARKVRISFGEDWGGA